MHDVRPKPSFAHPLMGASLSNLLRVYTRYGGVAPRAWPVAAASLGSAAVRTMLIPAEAVAEWSLRRRSAPSETPLFVIGHWRSGTTHLHNLLGRDPRFGIISPLAAGLPSELLTLVRWLRPWLERALPADRHIDRVAVAPDSPQEDEIPVASLQPYSIFHALYFPGDFERRVAEGVFFDDVGEASRRRWQRTVRRLSDRVSLATGRPKLVIKNPVYTARIELLLEIWPDARFVFIHRDPRDVFASTVHYFRTLVPDLCLQRLGDLDVESFVLRLYRRLHEAYDEGRRLLGEGRLVEVGFAELEHDPMALLGRIYSELELGGFEDAAPRIESYLGSLGDFCKNRYEVDPAQCDRVDEAWGSYRHRWGYDRPQ